MAGSERSRSMAMGVVAALASNCFLGVSSLYWKALAELPAAVLLGCRVTLSLSCVTLLLALRRKLLGMLLGLELRDIKLHCVASLLVAVNWAAFIWASINGHLLESGLGYLMAPLISLSLGLLLYRERLPMSRAGAIILVTGSVLYLLFNAGDLNARVFLVIGVTWGGYTWLKKLSNLSSLSGLFIESLLQGIILVPLIFWLYEPVQLIVALEHQVQGLLMLCGAVSLLPLAIFSFAARRLPLSIMGLMQFVLPLTQFCVAILFYSQAPSRTTVVAFGVIAFSMLLVISEPLSKIIFRKVKGLSEDG